MQITITAQSHTFERVLAKMAARTSSEKFSEHHELYGLSKEAFRPILWSIIEAEVQKYCEQPKADYAVLDYGFIVGLPLNDTVFMLAAGESGGTEQHTFEVIHCPNGNTGASDYMVNFYEMID